MWDKVLRKLVISDIKSRLIFIFWLFYYICYAISIFTTLISPIWGNEIHLLKILLDVVYLSMLVFIVLLMIVVITKKDDIVLAVNKMIELDATLKSWLN